MLRDLIKTTFESGKDTFWIFLFDMHGARYSEQFKRKVLLSHFIGEETESQGLEKFAPNQPTCEWQDQDLMEVPPPPQPVFPQVSWPALALSVPHDCCPHVHFPSLGEDGFASWKACIRLWTSRSYLWCYHHLQGVIYHPDDFDPSLLWRVSPFLDLLLSDQLKILVQPLKKLGCSSFWVYH